MKKILLILSLVTNTYFAQVTGFSLLYNGNIPNAAMGFTIQQEISNKRIVSVFFDVKGNVTLPEERVKEWTLASETTTDYYSYGITDWGSYVNNSTTQVIMVGNAVKPLVFNAGIGIDLGSSRLGYRTLNVGLGVCREKHFLVQDVSYYHIDIYNFEMIDYFDTYSSYDVYYKVIGEKNEYKVNFTANLLFENGPFIYGIGFDTKPAGVNLIVGLKF